MPYKGVRCRSDELIVNVKVFRPDENFGFETDELVKKVRDNLIGTPNDAENAAKIISRRLTSVLLEDSSVPWFEVEVFDKSGGAYAISSVNDSVEYQ